METQEYIPIDVFCRQHGIAVSLIGSLQNFGLIEVMHIGQVDCIPVDRLGEAEKILRLHTELEINLEGVDVITHLLEKIKEMQAEILLLKNRLAFYE